MVYRSQVSPEQRIENKTKVMEDGCWLWQGATKGSRNKTPSFFYKDECVPVHRWVYENEYCRKLKEGEMVLHTCGNTLCVNPDHLEASMTDTAGRPYSAKIRK